MGHHARRRRADDTEGSGLRRRLLRNLAREVGLTEIVSQGKFVRFGPVELPESASLRLRRLYPGAVLKPAVRQILVPAPTTARVGGRPVVGRAMLAWVRDLVAAVITGDVATAARVGTGGSGAPLR